MKFFLIKLITFILPFLAFYVFVSINVIPGLIKKAEGPTTKQQIDNSFRNSINRNYELLILGNSGTYRGINPDFFEIPAFNFSHDNDSYNQMYYKLTWLVKKNKIPKYVILGVDYFQFSFLSDSRNSVYKDWLEEDYLKDYKTAESSIWNLKEWYTNSDLFKFTRLKYLGGLIRSEVATSVQKENGQYCRPGKALPNDRYSYSINRLDIQVNYFEKLLALCAKTKCKVFLCMLPARSNALLNYTTPEIAEFNDFIFSHTSRDVVYLNHSVALKYSIEDYSDITHLNPAAADKYSIFLNSIIIKAIKE